MLPKDVRIKIINMVWAPPLMYVLWPSRYLCPTPQEIASPWGDTQFWGWKCQVCGYLRKFWANPYGFLAPVGHYHVLDDWVIIGRAVCSQKCMYLADQRAHLTPAQQRLPRSPSTIERIVQTRIDRKIRRMRRLAQAP